MKSLISSGVKWTTLSMVVTSSVLVLRISILSRLLTPKDFGLMALVLVVFGVVQIFQDFGLSNAIIQKQNISNSILSSLFWLNIIIALALSILTFFSSEFLSVYFNEAELSQLIAVIAPVFFFSSLGVHFRVLLQKEMQFKMISLVEISVSIFALVTAIFLAKKGLGVFSLLYSLMLQHILASIVFFIYGFNRFFKLEYRIRKAGLKSFIVFGYYQTLERIVNYISANVDKLIIAKFLTSFELGLYNNAWYLIFFPVSKINPILNKVAFPLYSKLQKDDEQLAYYYDKFIHLILIIVIPFFLILSWNSELLVGLFYGPQWSKVADYVPFMAIIGLLRASGNPSGAMLYAKGKTKVAFYWNLLFSVILILPMYLVGNLCPSVSNIIYSMLLIYICSNYIYHWIIQKYTGMPLTFVYQALLKYSISFGILSLIPVVLLSLITVASKDWILFGTQSLVFLAYILYNRNKIANII